MLNSELKIRVRYGETDRMGFVYYGNYAAYFEVARVEMLRSIGISYRDMEDDGIGLPVLEYKIKYIKPAFYDDHLTIKTVIKLKPSIRVRFEYETYNQKEELINVAETTLVFISRTTLKPCQPPELFQQKIHSYY